MAEEPFDLSGVLGIVSTLAVNYARADRQLLLQSVDQPHRILGSGLPFLQAVAGFRSKLRFHLTVDRNRGFLFDLIRTRRSERVAELSLDFSVAPTPLSTSTKDYAVSLWGTSPPGPDVQLGELTVPLSDARRLFVSFPSDGDIDDTRVRLGNRPSADFDRMHMGLLMDLLMALTALARDMSKSAPHPMRASRADRLESFLTDVAAGMGDALKKAAPVLRPDPENLSAEPAASRLGNVLGPHAIHYGFREMNAVFEVLLEPDGSIATKPFQDGAQRFSLSASLESSEAEPRLVLSLGIPDVLSSGPLHEILIAEFKKNRDQFWEKLDSPIDDYFSGKEEFGRILAAAKTTVVRIKRNRNGRDQNMIVFEGSLQSQPIILVFLADIKLQRDMSDSAFALDSLDVERMEAAKIGTGAWFSNRRNSKELTTYAHQVLLQIFRWRSRFSEGST